MTTHQIQLLFVDLALILTLAQLFGRAAHLVRQPPVVGEILVGLLLGPSLFHQTVVHALFPAQVRTALTGMADCGLALFMFRIGMEVDLGRLRGRGPVVARIAAGSVLVPFGLGLASATYLVSGHPSVNHGGSVVFIGLALSVTAFPVLARILADRGMTTTELGTIATATAAAVDVVAWVGLALVQIFTVSAGHAWRTALILPFLFILPPVVRALLRGFVGAGPARPGDSAESARRLLVLCLAGALLSGAATEALGLHFIFGGFFFGVLVRRDSEGATRVELDRRVEQITTVLLPVYFVISGLNVQLNGLTGSDISRLAVILAVALAGKLGGTYLGARFGGLDPRPAAGLAILMDTRGLTELVILGLGLSIGLIDTALYSLMVVMAVVTTALTGPLLSLLGFGTAGVGNRGVLLTPRAAETATVE